jgi:hypothetical protein
MKRIVRLTESDLTRIVRRVIKEQMNTTITLPTSIGSLYKTGGWNYDGNLLKLYSEKYQKESPRYMSSKVLYQFDKSDLDDSWDGIPSVSGTWTRVSDTQVNLKV